MPSPYLNPFQKFQQTERKLDEKQQILEMMAGQSQQPTKGNLKKVLMIIGGCSVITALFIGGILAYTSIIVEQSWFITGDTSKYNPIASYSEAAARAGNDARLVKIEAKLVQSDGTLNLNADYKPAPEVVFTFYREVPAPKNAPPPGAVSGDSNLWYETITLTAYKPGQMHSVKSFSGGGSSTYSYINLGLKKNVSSSSNSSPEKAANPPTCELKAFWDIAKQKGAPENAVSTVTYDANGYLFELRLEQDLKLNFDQNCQLLNPGESAKPAKETQPPPTPVPSPVISLNQ